MTEILQTIVSFGQCKRKYPSFNQFMRTYRTLNRVKSYIHIIWTSNSP